MTGVLNVNRATEAELRLLPGIGKRRAQLIVERRGKRAFKSVDEVGRIKEGLQDKLELYVDGTMRMLNASRGDWGDGMFYGGEYAVAFGPVKQGGKNFMQTAKITFEIGVSRN